MTLEERFNQKYCIDPDTGCWQWTAAKRSGGYGVIGHLARVFGAHRVSYELHVGPIPHGLQIDHLCRNRACVNPAHLRAVTQKVNILCGESVAAKHAKKTHCKYGHPFDEQNTATLSTRYERRCRQCHNEQSRISGRKRYATHRAEVVWP